MTYDGNTNGGGAVPSDGTAYASGSTVTVAGNSGSLTKSGYTFGGWCTTQPAAGATCVSVSGTSQAAASTFAISANTTLYAVWTADTYSVAYNGNTSDGGSVPSSQTKTHAIDLTLASNSGSLTKSGYTFGGWCTTQPAAGSACGGTSYAAGATYSANAAMTLYAVWTANTQTISYAAGTGGAGSAPSSPTSVSYGGTFTTPANTYSRTGHTFAGWSDGSSTYAAGATYPASGTVSANVTLTATWTANTQTISYAAGTGGTGSAPSSPTSVSYGGTFTTPANTYSRTGHTFAGWSDGSSTYAAGATYPASGTVSGNVTLTATWAASCAQGGTCVVGDTGPGGGKVFYVAGSNFTSTGSDCNTACRYLEVAPAASEATRTWATGGNQSSFVTGADATAIGSGYQNTVDISAQAGNVAATSAAVYALEYSNGGVSDWHLPSDSELTELYLRRATVGGLTADWTYWSSSEVWNDYASGRTFSTGASSSGFKKNVDNLARPVRAFGLPPFSVTYNGNTHGSGSVPTDSSTYSFNASVTVASNTGSLAKSGYTFGGWCTTQPAAGSACSGTSRAAGSTFSITSNVTLYAVWTTLTCATGGTCVVGDTGPGGGVVFYVAGSNFTSTGSDCVSSCRYLEVAPAESESPIAWATNVNSNYTRGVTGADATGIGSGRQNTVDVTNQAGNVQASSAAVYAWYYSNNSKTDWHLSSKDELNELCKYARQQTTGDTSVACASTGSLRTGFSADRYWSSSEISATGAWTQNFSNGTKTDVFGKANAFRVRPIRAF